MASVNPQYLLIGKRLVELRTAIGLTQAQAGRTLKIKPRTYQNYEYGVSKPNTENLRKIIGFYNCSYIWFLTGDGGPYPDRPQEKNDAASISSDNVVYLNPASRILDKAIAEAGVDLNDAQKAALMKIVQDELTRTGDKVKEIINVFKKEV